MQEKPQIKWTDKPFRSEAVIKVPGQKYGFEFEAYVIPDTSAGVGYEWVARDGGCTVFKTGHSDTLEGGKRAAEQISVTALKDAVRFCEERIFAYKEKEQQLREAIAFLSAS